jgi:NAD(P)-dependent dehydrogenase (short-subunit alcohol dehydrogenase family)
MTGQPIVLITGATGGIGRVTAQLLVEDGWRVFGTSRSPAEAGPIPGVTLLPLDVHSPESVCACVDSVLAQAGRIDALVNNAGIIGPAAASEEMDLDQAHALFETNFFGVVAVTNAVLPHMRAQGGGTIVFISSAGGRVAAMPFFSFYAASKHALEAYGEGLRYEVRRLNIKVALVEPGYTHTDILKNTTGPRHSLEAYEHTRQDILLLDQAGLRYGAPPQAAARAVLRALRSPDPALHYLAGSDSAWITALKCILPARLFEGLVDWMFFRWKPPPGSRSIPTPAGLGLRRILFHQPTRDLTIRGALAAGLAGALAALVIWRRPGRERPSARP